MKSQNDLFVLDRPEKRRYDDACAAAHGLDLIGERWALLVIRELMFGPRRFSDLRAVLSGISANVLTQRLEGLESSGILLRRKLPPPAAVWVYELTPWGYEAEALLQVIGRWAARSPMHDPRKPISAASTLLSMRTMLDTNRARALTGRIGFRFGEEDYVGRLAAGHLAIQRGDIREADVTFETEPRTLAALLYAGLPIESAETDGTLRLTGDRGLAHRFVGLFPLPEKASSSTA